MNKKIQLTDGWIRSQPVDFLYQGQKLLFKSGNKLVPCLINHDLEGDLNILAKLEGIDEDVKLNKADLRRLVVTDGERFVPLQHDDWKEALEKNLPDSDIQFQYYVIERKAKNNTVLRLGRIYRPNEKERNIAKLAYDAGVIHANSDKTFDDYWKEAQLETEYI